MNREWVIAGIGALLLHGLLLFGFRLETAAVALPVGDTTVDVNLVDAAPNAAPPAPAASEQPPEPTPTPPSPTPPPPPEPEPTPSPTPPPPVPENTPAVPAPPIPHAHPPHHAPAHPAHPAAPATSAAGVEHGAPTAGLRGTSNNAVRPMFNPKPDYPPEADRLGQRGVVLLDVEVNAQGRVTGVSVKRSSGFPSLDDAAVRGIRRWIFEPARVAGLPIASRAEVPVKFEPPR